VLLGVAAIGLGGACGGAAGCTRAPPPVPDERLLALVSGCASLVVEQDGAPPSCALAANRRVRLYVPGESADRVAVDLPSDAGAPGASPSPSAKRVAGGHLVDVLVPDGAATVTVRRTDAAGKRASFVLVLASKPRPAWFDEAQALRQKGELDAAEARVASATGPAAVPPASDADRAMAEGLLARIAMRRGKVDEADRHFRGAIELDARTGRISDRADDAFALVFLLHQRSRRYPEARRVLDDVAGELSAYPDGRAREPLYRGQVAWEAGDTRTALRLLALAVDRADRLGAEGIARAARQVRGMVMCNAGSTQSCVATLREAEHELATAEGVTPCERAELAMGLGYAELEAAQTSGTNLASAGDADRRALGYLAAGCPDTYLRTVALEHLALADVLGGDAGAARRHLDEAKAGTSEPRISDALFWSDVEARILAREGKRTAALAAFDVERTRAVAAAREGEVWRALVGRGRVLEESNDTRQALDAYRAADDVLEDALVAVPFGEGRSSVSAESREGTDRAAALLVKLGRDGEALDVVRRARSRLVRSLARSEHVAALAGPERERWEHAIAAYKSAREALDAEAAGDWKLAKPALEAAVAARRTTHAGLRAALDDAMAIIGGGREERLPALSSDELIVAYVDLGASGGLRGFVVEGARVRSFAVARDAWLTPIAAELERARRVRFLVDDVAASVDLHALAFRGQPLVAHVPVVYGLDLGVRSPSAPSAPSAVGGTTARPVALVVADPTGDLPSAREEGDTAFAHLAARYETRRLTGHEATAARVREALPGLAFLHYAGHGVFAGKEGAESALPLAGGGALTVGDVLAMPGAPAHVVLSGCEAGRQLGARDEGAAGIASAFLVAGGAEVVAPVRVVDDRAASVLVRDLHAALERDPEHDLVAALRAAQERAIHDGHVGWEAFRVFAR
jgi:tetratricopeptide (TPR) repeat protein